MNARCRSPEQGGPHYPLKLFFSPVLGLDPAHDCLLNIQAMFSRRNRGLTMMHVPSQPEGIQTFQSPLARAARYEGLARPRSATSILVRVPPDIDCESFPQAVTRTMATPIDASRRACLCGNASALSFSLRRRLHSRIASNSERGLSSRLNDLQKKETIGSFRP